MNWPLVELGDIFLIARGGSPRPIDKFITEGHDGVNWVMISDASNSSKFITETKKKIKPSGVSRSRAVAPGDFLLTNSMSFGRPYIMQTSGCIHDGWLVLSSKKPNVDQDYFYHLLGSDRVYAEFEKRAAGATVKNLNIDLVKGVKVPLPPLDEQRRIAAILDQADALRRKRREATAQLGTLRTALLAELIGYLGSQIQFFSLAECISEFRYGTSERSTGTGLPILRIPNVIGSTISLDDLKYVPLSENETARLRLQSGDLIFVRTNGNREYVGRSAVVPSNLGKDIGLTPQDFVYASYLIRGRPETSKVDPVFLQSYLSGSHGRRSMLERAKTSAGQFNINIESLSSLPVPVPDLRTQREFAAKVAAIDIEVERSRVHERHLDALFSSLQHRAFRGEL